MLIIGIMQRKKKTYPIYLGYEPQTPKQKRKFANVQAFHSVLNYLIGHLIVTIDKNH